MNTASHSKDVPEPASWEASVSAWVDGEESIRSEELNLPYGRHVWDTYHLIGDVMRSGELGIQPSERFYARVSQAIDKEPPIVAPHARRRLPVRLGVSGLVVAAAVASVVWVALPYFSGSGPAQVQVVASASDNPGLTDYLDAHSQLIGAGPVRQVSFDTGVVR
ncbi:MAG TPA: sigma-E factor negative regulatory protein [Burkholderiaceae bacterium]|nr:sigma-E factor negative regulatory protein [Burkholderiaceae bacterium]